MDENTPTMESITRCRRKYQESGLYVGENRKERLQEAEDVRLWARNSKKEGLAPKGAAKNIIKSKLNSITYEDASF